MLGCIEEMLPHWRKQFEFHTLVINADNGPECCGRRKQWLKRLIDFAGQHCISIQLSYYPPYHSKYKSIERVWGAFENHWKGEILDSMDKALGLVRSMTFREISPTVRKVKKVYKKGVTLTGDALVKVEERLDRKKGLENWSIGIQPLP